MANNKNSQPSFMRKYWAEFLSVALLLMGVFLLLERLEIKVAIYGFFLSVLRKFDTAVLSAFRTLRQLEGSDWIGLLMLLAAAWLLGFRFRTRVIQRHTRFEDDECPRCSNALNRVHRTLAHRLLEVVFRVRIRRYSCPKCKFSISPWRSRCE